MDNPQAFLIAREVASTTGINEKGRLELVALAVVTPGFHEGFVVISATFRYRPTLAHVGTRRSGVLEQQVIKDGSLDLKGGGLTGETAIAKNEFQSFAGISEVKLSSKFPRETGCLKRGQHTHFFEKLSIIRQQRFSYMESREELFLENQDTFSRAGEESGYGAPTRSAADHDCIIRHRQHGED